MNTMRAAQLVGRGRFDVREVPVPAPASGQVFVRLIGTSICGSDLHVVYDDAFVPPLPAPPGFPGHEGVGIVEDSRHPGFVPGDLVLAVPHAATFTTFADLHLGDASHLIGLPADGDPWRLLMAQQLGTVVYAMKHFVPAPVDGGTAVVIGAGSAGYFFAQLARTAGYRQLEPFPFAPAWRKMLTLIGCVYAQREPGLPSFRTAVDLIAAGAVRVDPLLSAPALPLEDLEAAFEHARTCPKEKVALRVAVAT